MTDYLILGNGVAGNTAAEHIRNRDTSGRITIVTDEDIPFYWRIRLNDYIAGDITEGTLLSKRPQWYEKQKIDLRLETRAIGANPDGRRIYTADGSEIPYHKLLVATGSHSFTPPIRGSDMEGVFTLRNVRDARAIIDRVKETDGAVLIGGGLLGLETGNALRKLGKAVAVVEFFPRLLPRQLDVAGARKLQDIMEAMGFSFHLGAKTKEIQGERKAGAVVLEDGQEIPAPMVIVSAGVRPNLEPAQALGLECDKGIKVDEHLRTNREGIYAAGDVIEFKGRPYGIWPAAMDQGKIAGINMSGGNAVYTGTTMATTLKVAGVALASAGDIDAENRLESRVRSNADVYKKIALEGDRITGCIMLGDTKGFNRITRAMSENKDVSGIKDRILEDGFDFSRL